MFVYAVASAVAHAVALAIAFDSPIRPRKWCFSHPDKDDTLWMMVFVRAHSLIAIAGLVL